MKIFEKVFIKIEISNSDVQNQDLSTILSKQVISQRYYQNRDFYRKFQLNSRFLQILNNTKILEYIDQNRNLEHL